MGSHWVQCLRNHWHALLIVPLVVIVMTWPTFARIFDHEEFWQHTSYTYDAWQKYWDAWHIGRVLAGQSEFFYTDAIFHPRGLSLSFHAASTPHALLLFLLQQIIPVDDAFNLLYLLMLCFNALCAYALINQLLKDNWIALFGAVVVGVNCWFTDYVPSPDLLMIGTLPLTIYYLNRSVIESRWLYAALAGICAGVTAFIGVYTFLFLLLSVGVYAIYLAISRWRQRDFWLRLLLLLSLSGLISLFRLYPMVAEGSVFQEGLEHHREKIYSGDVLDFFILSRNPLTSDLLHSAFNTAANNTHRNAYLGYINIFFLACAVIRPPAQRRLTPWLLMLFFFAILRMGDHLTVNGQAHTSIALPQRFLSDSLPAVFGAIGQPAYYQIGIVIPLAVLSCYGLSALLRSSKIRARIAVVLLCITILSLEYYLPRQGFVFEREKNAYLNWLQSDSEVPIKIIELPQRQDNLTYYLYTQSLSGYPSAYGYANRNRRSARSYIDSNYILHTWRIHRPAVCLPGQNAAAFIAALDQLLQDGFTHIVLHHWRIVDEDLEPSFVNVPAAYADEFVKVYRLADLRRNCEAPSTVPLIDRFMQQSRVLPGDGSSIISYNPSKSIDANTLAYLGLLFSKWDSFQHLYHHEGQWVTQTASRSAAAGDESALNRRIVYLLYDAGDGPPRLSASVEFRDDFNLCRREAYEDGAVIELYFNPRFSCALVNPSAPPHVIYDNGALLSNLLYELNQDALDLQILWRYLPDQSHSISVQIFDAAGDKAHGQDFVIGSRAITRHHVDLSSLPPGDYVFKLIFYRYSNGKSVPGTVSSSGARFNRALDFATIRKS